MRFLDPFLHKFNAPPDKKSKHLKEFNLKEILDENIYISKIESTTGIKCSDIFRKYTKYHAIESRIIINEINNEVISYVKKIYEEDKDSHISFIRNHVSRKVCPICGSFSTSQVDHHLDKSRMGIYYSFPRNLIPACQCNQHKTKKLLDFNNGERILHPYIDTILKKPIAKFDVYLSNDKSNLLFDVCATDEYKELKAVSTHINNIFTESYKDKVRGYAFDNLLSFLREIVKINEISNRYNILELKIFENDSEYETPNNWNSMTYRGIKESNIFHMIIKHPLEIMNKMI